LRVDSPRSSIVSSI
jgi:hypothetical protein